MAETLGWGTPMRRPASSCVRSSRRRARAISITSPDLILSLSAPGKPRSAKTLPELVSTSFPSTLRFAISHFLRQRRGDLQSRANNVHVLLRRGDSTRALLLEAMEDKDGFLKFHGVNGAIGAVAVVLDDFQDPAAANAPEDLRRP